MPKPNTIEEVEQDLKDFLNSIKPIIEVAVNGKGKSTLFLISKVTKLINSKDGFVKDPDKLFELLEKYRYLMD